MLDAVLTNSFACPSGSKDKGQEADRYTPKVILKADKEHG
jgi:hypothetical protein